MSNRISRKEFLRASIMTAAGLAAASCAQPTPEVIEKEVVVEKIVKETVVSEKEVAVEKVVTATAVTMKYKEAPMLAGMVAAGDLPPVDERLPENPGVAEPVEEIGEYGGTWHRLATSVGDIQTPYRLMSDTFVHWDKDGTTLSPHVAESFEYSPDGKTLTLSLRKGMKWSDGEPFTAADPLFYYEDVLMNKEMRPSFPSSMSPGGEPMVVEALDDYTLRFAFAAPFPLFVRSLAACCPGVAFTLFPKHYLSQFHIDYADKAALEKMTADRGFEFWYQLFGEMGGGEWAATPKTNVDFPVIHAWRVTVPAPKQPVVLERNPYYWRVDPEGQQLPYIDRIEHMIVQGADQINLRAMQGEVDMQHRHITFINYPLYQENKEQGDYRILLWPQGFISNGVISINMHSPDEVLRPILQDKRFRYALSLGMNRSEIIEVVNLGMGEPTQTGPLPTSPHYWEEQAKNMTEHDPDRANAYLDEMGLTERDSDGFRLRPDGKRLTLVFEYAPTFGAWGDLAELLRAHWEDIGIEIIVKEINRQLWEERHPEIDITVWTGNGEFDPELYNDTMRAQHLDNAWNSWLESDGAEGVEPPDFFKRQYEIAQQILVTVSAEERAKLLRELLEIHKEQMVVIGTTTAEPQPVIVKNNFRNVPESAVSDWNLLSPGHTYPDQYFIRQS